MVGTLETRAFVTCGFRQPLLIGRFAIHRTGRQDFTVLNRQRPEIHRVVIRVDPLIDVSRTIENFDYLKFVIIDLSVLDHIVTVVIPSPSASAPVIHIETRFGRTRFFDMHDAEVQGALRSPRSVPQHLGQRSVPAFQPGKRKS
jgi:hypothetical protein